MFSRKEQTYIIGDSALDAILGDAAQPLGQISELLPEGASVLDIGAGNGMLGRVLKRASKQVTLDAIEPCEFAVDLAKPFYRKVYHGYAQDYSNMIMKNKYDYIVLADVLEHTTDPLGFLSDIIHDLDTSTKVIVSIPNIAFGGVRLSLLNGMFDYVDSGLLERTHLRFFTLSLAQKLFQHVNLYSERTLFLKRSFYRMEFSRKMLRSSPFTILNLAFKSEALAYQYMFVLSKEPKEPKLEYYGASTFTVILDALFAWPMIKRMIHRWKKT
ncbi:MAG: class I SAM-dependent methyltransferase [Mariprofundaceae bacterium]|nr:class I SAM-dependent methyltransferase [Mariprofundaceae bacterium]